MTTLFSLHLPLQISMATAAFGEKSTWHERHSFTSSAALLCLGNSWQKRNLKNLVSLPQASFYLTAFNYWSAWTFADPWGIKTVYTHIHEPAASVITAVKIRWHQTWKTCRREYWVYIVFSSTRSKMMVGHQCQRVCTMTGYSRDMCSAPLMGSLCVV